MNGTMSSSSLCRPRLSGLNVFRSGTVGVEHLSSVRIVFLSSLRVFVVVVAVVVVVGR